MIAMSVAEKPSKGNVGIMEERSSINYLHQTFLSKGGTFLSIKRQKLFVHKGGRSSLKKLKTYSYYTCYSFVLYVSKGGTFPKQIPQNVCAQRWKVLYRQILTLNVTVLFHRNLREERSSLKIA